MNHLLAVPPYRKLNRVCYSMRISAGVYLWWTIKGLIVLSLAFVCDLMSPYETKVKHMYTPYTHSETVLIAHCWDSICYACLNDWILNNWLIFNEKTKMWTSKSFCKGVPDFPVLGSIYYLILSDRDWSTLRKKKRVPSPGLYIFCYSGQCVSIKGWSTSDWSTTPFTAPVRNTL